MGSKRSVRRSQVITIVHTRHNCSPPIPHTRICWAQVSLKPSDFNMTRLSNLQMTTWGCSVVLGLSFMVPFFKHYYFRVARTCHYCALVMIVYSWTGLLINYCNSALSISFNWGPSVGSWERELWPSVILRRLLTSQSIAFLWNFETSLPRKLRHRWFDHLTDCLQNARSHVGIALLVSTDT